MEPFTYSPIQYLQTKTEGIFPVDISISVGTMSAKDMEQFKKDWERLMVEPPATAWPIMTTPSLPQRQPLYRPTEVLDG